MTEELKPCPNCGGEGKITPYVDKFDGRICGYYVLCEACSSRIYICACEFPAVCDWNSGYLIVKI